MAPTKDLLAFRTQSFGAFHRIALPTSLSPPEPRFAFYIENLGVDISAMVSQTSQASQASQPPSSIANLWRARSGCPEHLRPHLERLVNGFPVAWLAAPVTGDVFETLVEAERRLKAFSLAEGFDIVRTIGGSKRVPGSTFQCIHHGVKTANKRRLEDRVTRDSEDEIVSKRKREGTAVRQTGCNWRVRVSWKRLDRNSDEKAFILTVSSLDHEGHSLYDDSLIVYPRQMAQLEEFQQIKLAAIYHRTTIIPYSASRRVLEAEEFGLNLTSKQYYNLVRKSRPS